MIKPIFSIHQASESVNIENVEGDKKMKEGKVAQDMRLDPPNSLRQIVLDELNSANYADFIRGKPIEPVTDKTIEPLMEKVFAHIERRALEIYKSNDVWALRRYALENILGEEIASEATVGMADILMAPVMSWQNEQPLDPLAYYKHRLTYTLRKRPETIRVYMLVAGRFVGKFGRKTHYSDDEVLQYLDWAGEHFKEKQSSYVCECQRLLQFLRNLPGANRDRKLPIVMPQMPTEFRQPMLSDDEIELIAWATVLDKIKPNMVVRLVVASIYGGRVSELSQLNSDDFYLDGDKSYIFIPTMKRGVRKKQPIPQSLVPLFQVPISPIRAPTLHNKLKKVLRKAEIPWQYGMGFHSFRRNVVTCLDKLGTQSDMAVYKFMRWSTPRHLGMLDRYRRTPTEVSDMKILDNHPRVTMWRDIIPYLVEFNPYYHSAIDILTYQYDKVTLKLLKEVFEGKPHLRKLLQGKRL